MNADIYELVRDLRVTATLESEEVSGLLVRAADLIEELDSSNENVLRVEAAKLEEESNEHYDEAYGKEFAQWTTEAAHATRLRIAAEVLKERVK